MSELRNRMEIRNIIVAKFLYFYLILIVLWGFKSFKFRIITFNVPFN